MIREGPEFYLPVRPPAAMNTLPPESLTGQPLTETKDVAYPFLFPAAVIYSQSTLRQEAPAAYPPCATAFLPKRTIETNRRASDGEPWTALRDT